MEDNKDKEMLIELSTKMDNLLIEVKRINSYQDSHNERLRNAEMGVALAKERAEINLSEIEKLRSASNLQDVLVAIASAIAIGISFFIR